MRLPVMASQVSGLANRRREAGAIPEIDPQRILVADDNHDAAEALSLQLQFAGHDVRTAHDGVEALDLAKTFDPDIVLLDLGMPKMDGYETARQLRLRSSGRRMTLIALTGWGQQQDRDRTADAGFDAHLVKPVAEAQLFRALGDRRRGKRANRGSASRVAPAPRRVEQLDQRLVLDRLDDVVVEAGLPGSGGDPPPVPSPSAR